MNRLAAERSPYLLQHKDNPVDWYPWCDEAFERARREGKPVFLSVGYAACHWCHVMERESFEDEEIARYLNEHFISIKVDREERPDIDAIYMAVTQALTGQGGWPMTVFLTPERKPFFAGTYFPPADRYGRPGFPTVLERLAAAWRTRREDITRSGDEIARLLARRPETGAPVPLDEAALRRAFEQLRGAFDERHGGFGGAPKFPPSYALRLLLRWWRRSGEPQALAMVHRTLDAMARGGMYDQLGGGFHRYATDQRWLVPHFEKMLYDQALLAPVYVEAYLATGAETYARTAREVLDYVLRDLRSPEGGFYSAEDADSEGIEGRFYVFSYAEITAALGEEDGRLLAEVYGATAAGNYREEATGEATGWSILHLPVPLAEAAQRRGMDPHELERRLAPLRERLRAAREQRPRPFMDRKVLTDWNGLMIAALAQGAQALDEPRYADAAARAAGFLLDAMRRPDGRLLHRSYEGEAGVLAFHEDYAFLCLGLLELYEATFDPRWLREARALAGDMLRLFRDDADGSFYLAGSDQEALIARTKETFDGAVPSGTSAAALALLRLGRLLADRELEQRGEEALAALSPIAREHPRALPFLLIAADFALGPTREVVVAGAPDSEDTRAMIRGIRGRFDPHKVVALRPPDPEGGEVAALLPYAQAMTARGGRATAYVCTGYACGEPLTDAEALASALETPPAGSGPH